MNDERLCVLLLLTLSTIAAAAFAQPAAETGLESPRPFLARGADDRLVVRGVDGAALLEIETPPGLEAPSLTPAGDDGWVFSAGYPDRGRRELLLVHRAPGESPVRVAPPPGAEGSVRSQPVALVAAGSFDGLAWLEGDDRRRLSVRAAARNGEEWEAAVTVAPPAAGTQTALSGAILEDGTWLLAWSAFDGTDDDIMISLRRGETWSAPERAHADNRTPDITPAVAPYRGGARLAWSRFDGEAYRLVLATLRAGRVTDAREIAEPGSVLPTFPSQAGGERLLYRSVRPYGWTLLEIDATSRPWRRAQFPDTVFGDRSEPLVSTDASGVVLSWPERGKRLERAWEPVL